MIVRMGEANSIVEVTVLFQTMEYYNIVVVGSLVVTVQEYELRLRRILNTQEALLTANYRCEDIRGRDGGTCKPERY
jgi:hypothetical protein